VAAPYYDDPAEVPQAADAFRRVLTSQHFKNDIDALAVGQLANGLFVVLLFVVDPVM
jgi:hypothetical protein